MSEQDPALPPAATASQARHQVTVDSDVFCIEDGIVKLPSMTKGRWYMMNKTPKY